MRKNFIDKKGTKNLGEGINKCVRKNKMYTREKFTKFYSKNHSKHRKNML